MEKYELTNINMDGKLDLSLGQSRMKVGYEPNVNGLFVVIIGFYEEFDI